MPLLILAMLLGCLWRMDPPVAGLLTLVVLSILSVRVVLRGLLGLGR